MQAVRATLAAVEDDNYRQRLSRAAGLQEATTACVNTLQSARSLGLRTRAYVAVAFDCPFEGQTSLSTVLSLVDRMGSAGADEVVVADTIGSAAPSTVRTYVQALCSDMPADKLAVHFHDTRGMGMDNAWAALEGGIRRFDSSVGGIGGCPFAPGAAGNLATEDLVLLAHRCGYETGISLDGLLDVVDVAEQMLDRPLGGRSIAWLRRQRKFAEANN